MGIQVVVGRARLRETLKQSKQMCRGFETFRHPSLRWHLVVIFKYWSETASTTKQLRELTNYTVCCITRATKWFGGVVSVLGRNAVSRQRRGRRKERVKFYVQRQFFLSIRAVIRFPVSSCWKIAHLQYITLFPIAGAHQDWGSNPAKDKVL